MPAVYGRNESFTTGTAVGKNNDTPPVVRDGRTTVED
jgi:hypothetical protein